uniref:Uncharacterized protein n=1 Tax=Tanacetum cinerariifolium TaxID=118510 RepID=A0A6L2JGV8_TANCI|nr:hypothetical protein [Tanacetum cinerariifolium]
MEEAYKGFGDWKWRLATLPFAFGRLVVYSAGDVLNYAFFALRLQFAGLQTKLLRHTGIVAFRPNFDDALSMFNTSMETGLLCNPNGLMDSQREDHTFDWLRAVSIFGLGQTMNACSRVFNGDIYGDHAISCAGIVGIKHHHNVLRNTLFDICYRSRNLVGLDVYVDLTGSSPLTQTKMANFVPGLVVIDAAQHKRGTYMAKCAVIGYSFLPFSFSSLKELEADEVTLLKRIQKFSMA